MDKITALEGAAGRGSESNSGVGHPADLERLVRSIAAEVAVQVTGGSMTSAGGPARQASPVQASGVITPSSDLGPLNRVIGNPAPPQRVPSPQASNPGPAASPATPTTEGTNETSGIYRLRGSLLSEHAVREAVKSGAETIRIPRGALVTPLARDLIRDRKLKLQFEPVSGT